MNYWAKRLQERQDALFKLTHEETQARYSKAYTEAVEATQRDIEALYDTLLAEAADGKIKMNDLYRYNRYFELQSKLNQRLISLGNKEISITDEKLLKMYQITQKLVKDECKGLGINLVLDNPQSARAAIDSIWCADGKHWSSRIWKQKSLLQSSIEKGFLNCVARGVPKDEFIKELKGDFNATFRNADRLARTELTYIQNKSAADRYKENGIEQYKYLAALDDRTSEMCKETNGKIFKFAEMATGTNFPPLHPNCRCTIIPVVEGGN